MNKVRDVTSQVQEECDPRRQFVLAEVSLKGQEEHCHQVSDAPGLERQITLLGRRPKTLNAGWRSVVLAGG